MMSYIATATLAVGLLATTPQAPAMAGQLWQGPPGDPGRQSAAAGRARQAEHRGSPG